MSMMGIRGKPAGPVDIDDTDVDIESGDIAIARG
jgi:hypothetical protein